MNELMRVSPSIKTPAMEVRLRPDWAFSQERCNEAMARLQTTSFRDVVLSSAIHFEPPGAEPAKENADDPDAGMLAFHRELAKLGVDAGAEDCGPDASSPWLLRFEFDRAKMLDLQIG